MQKAFADLSACSCASSWSKGRPISEKTASLSACSPLLKLSPNAPPEAAAGVLSDASPLRPASATSESTEAWLDAGAGGGAVLGGMTMQWVDRNRQNGTICNYSARAIAKHQADFRRNVSRHTNFPRKQPRACVPPLFVAHFKPRAAGGLEGKNVVLYFSSEM